MASYSPSSSTPHPPPPPTCAKSKDHPVLCLSDAVSISQSNRPKNYTSTVGVTPPKSDLFGKLAVLLLVVGVLAGAITIIVYVSQQSDRGSQSAFGTVNTGLCRLNVSSMSSSSWDDSLFRQCVAYDGEVQLSQVVVVRVINTVNNNYTVYFFVGNLSGAAAAENVLRNVQFAVTNPDSVLRLNYGVSVLLLERNVVLPPSTVATPPPKNTTTTAPSRTPAPPPTPKPTIPDVYCMQSVYPDHSCAVNLTLDSTGRCQCTGGYVCGDGYECVTPTWACSYSSIMLSGGSNLYPTCTSMSLNDCMALCLNSSGCSGLHYDPSRPRKYSCSHLYYQGLGYGTSYAQLPQRNVTSCRILQRRLLAHLAVTASSLSASVGDVVTVSVTLDRAILRNVSVMIMVNESVNVTNLLIKNGGGNVVDLIRAGDMGRVNLTLVSAGVHRVSVVMSGLGANDVEVYRDVLFITTYHSGVGFFTLLPTTMTCLEGYVSNTTFVITYTPPSSFSPSFALNATLSTTQNSTASIVLLTSGPLLFNGSITKHNISVVCQSKGSAWVYMNSSSSSIELPAMATITAQSYAVSASTDLYNHARNGTATQSSTASGCTTPCGASAPLTTSSSSSTSSFSMTSFVSPADVSPWWLVTFPYGLPIHSVVLENTAVGPERLQNITVEILSGSVNNNPKIIAVVGPLNVGNVLNSPAFLVADKFNNLTAVYGNMVRIRKGNADGKSGISIVLSLARVQILSTQNNKTTATSASATVVSTTTTASTSSIGNTSTLFRRLASSGYVTNIASLANVVNQSSTACDDTCTAEYARNGAVCPMTASSVERTMTTITGNDTNPTLGFYFKTQYYLHSVVVFNRFDCCGGRLRSVQLTFYMNHTIVHRSGLLDATSTTETDPSVITYLVTPGLYSDAVTISKSITSQSAGGNSSSSLLTVSTASTVSSSSSGVDGVLSVAEVDINAYGVPSDYS